METVAYYTLELTRPPHGWGELPELSARARATSEQLTREGRRVRFVRSVFVPEDETCFHVYEAGCADDIQEVARRAELAVGHVVEAITQLKGERA